MAPNEKKDASAGTEDLEELEEVFDEDGNDITDWQGLAKKNFGMAKRYKTDVDNLKTDFEAYKTTHPEAPPKEEPAKSQDKKDFDLAEKSYLLASGIKKEQIPLVWDEVQKSGKPIDEILESPYFQEKLEMEASKAAVPSGTPRSGGAARDSVEYWMARGEFPPKTPENKELRRKILHTLEKQSTEGSKFSPNPIV